MRRPPVNYCQVCGEKLIDRLAFGQIRRVCPACGFVHFDDPKVAVVAFIERDNRVLLVRRAMNPEQGKWALPAGYVDYGEDPRDAIVREVLEETGLRIEVTQLLDVHSSPGNFGASIIIVYGARVVGGVAHPQDDADAILWYSATDPLPALAFHSTQTLLADWIARQKGNR